MSEEQPQQKFVWRLAVYKLLNGCFIAGATAYIGATAAVNWADMHWNERVIIILTAMIAMGKLVEAWFDSTVPKLLTGKNPFTNGGNGSAPETSAPKVDSPAKPES